jgi:predicted ATP-dependent protease
MIRSGALHRANGGILILRAEALAADPMAWQFLKGALRDGEIRIEEPHRMGSLPLTGAPQPRPIPLKVKIVVVGDPQYYYAFHALDPEFAFYFKVKADIDATMDADACNVDTFTRLIRQAARRCAGLACEDGAVQALLGQCARWTGDRTKLAATFELVEDVLAEAAIGLCEPARAITAEHIKAAIVARRLRNSALEDHSHELIARSAVMIRTHGAATGQVNGLTVRAVGDHIFGSPARVTARTYVGRRGIINIDRLTGHGGPIQQKGMFILGGYLHGLFSERCPISFSATVTFEQMYAGVEGDSASLAELCAILSSLADLPVRQDLAVTGSVNQVGEAQVIGGLHHKIEGFFRACQELGLTGTQGVIFPRANETNLVLRDEVAEAVSQGKFHLWSVEHVDDVLELFTGLKAGRPGADGRFPSRTVYGKVQAKLESHDRILGRRERAGEGPE